jgi:DNA-binding protein H-NS
MDQKTLDCYNTNAKDLAKRNETALWRDVYNSFSIYRSIYMARTENTATQIAKLKKQLEALQKKEGAVKSKKQEKSLAQIVKLAKENEISAKAIQAALGAGKAKKATKSSPKKSGLKGKVVPPKYRNPANHEQTWTGRGIAPTWVQALKVQGKLDSALIHPVQQQQEVQQAEQQQ